MSQEELTNSEAPQVEQLNRLLETVVDTDQMQMFWRALSRATDRQVTANMVKKFIREIPEEAISAPLKEYAEALLLQVSFTDINRQMSTHMDPSGAEKTSDMAHISVGSAAVSANTAGWSVLRQNVGWGRYRAGQFAEVILSLDAVLYALLSRERVYLLVPRADSDLWSGWPSRHWIGDSMLPIELMYYERDYELPPEIEGFTDVLLSDTGFVNIASAAVVDNWTFDPNDERISLMWKMAGVFARQDPAQQIFVKQNAQQTVDSLYQSMELRLPFFASQKETPVCIADQLVNQKLPSRRVIRKMGEIWRAKATEINDPEFRFFTIKMPFFLLAVLRECGNSADFWKVVVQMRDTKEVRNFREWTTKLDTEPDGTDVERALRNTQEMALDLARVSGRNAGSTMINLGFSITGPSAGVSLNPASVALNLPWRNRHLRFMKRLFRNALEIGALEKELVRLFGVQPETAREAVSLVDSIARVK